MRGAMKKIILLFLFCVPIVAQSNLIKIIDKPKYARGSAIDLDGSTEYMSKTSPTNLDVNGTERITNEADRTFSTLVNWAVLGDTTNKIGRSSVDKHAGTYSMVDTTSGAGSTDNCVNLPYANFTALGTDANSIYEKYTLELWARGTGILGSDLTLGHGSFTTSADSAWWTKGTNVTIGGGVVTCATTTGDIIRRNALLTAGITYAITWTITSYTSGNAYLATSGATGSSRASTGTFTEYLTPTGTNFTLGGNSFVGVIDNVIILPITRPSITLAIGGQSKTIANVSCVPGTFTKLVWNFQATANEVNQPIKVYANQLDTVYIDDVSLTKKHDFLLLTWVNTATSYTDNRGLFLISNIRVGIYYGQVRVAVSSIDGVSFSGMSNGNWHLIGAYYNATLGVDIIKDGVLRGSYTVDTSGKLTLSTFYLGLNPSFGVPFAGQIGEVQIVRFTDIAQSNVNTTTLTSAYRLGIPKTWIGGGAQVVGHWKFRGSTSAQMLKDISNTDNDLTGVNTDINDMVRGTYPSK